MFTRGLTVSFFEIASAVRSFKLTTKKNLQIFCLFGVKYLQVFFTKKITEFVKNLLSTSYVTLWRQGFTDDGVLKTGKFPWRGVSLEIPSFVRVIR